MQQRVLQVHDVDELKQRLIDVWHHFENAAEFRKFRFLIFRKVVQRHI